MGIGDQYGWVTVPDGTLPDGSPKQKSVPPGSPEALSVYGPYAQATGNGNDGSMFGWVTVRGPTGSPWRVPPNSPEASKYPKITQVPVGKNGQHTVMGWSDEADGTFKAPGAQQPVSTSAGAPDTYGQQIQDFYKRMTSPLDMNDPEVKQAIATGVNTNQRAASYGGIQGGISRAGLVKSAMSSANGLAQQRQQMGLQALTLGSNRDLGLGTEAGVNSRYASDLAQSNQINSSNQERANLQALASAGGQAASGLIGAIKSPSNTYAPNNVGGSNSFNTETGQYGSDPGNWSNPF